MSDNQPQVRTCPDCGGSLVNTSHGPYCPNQHCKWGWEVELDGSPLKPPLPQPTPAEPWIETVPDERAAWRKWFISEYGFPSSKLDDVSWEAWRARAGSSLIAEPPECGALLSVPGYAGLMRTVSMETASRFDSGDIPLVYFSGISLEIYQQDWSPGWASFLEDGSIAEGAKAHATLNLGSCLVAVESGELPAKDLPYLIAESIMHEAIHALESWAKVEFSEERVEGLIEVYRKKYRPDDEKHWHSDPTLERDNSNQFASPPSSPGAAPERSNEDYAIEHGEYLAKSAEFLLNSINEENRLQVEADPDRDEELIDNAREIRNDAWKGLNSAIYEFRKRAKRCSPGAAQTCPTCGDVLLRQTSALTDDYALYCPRGHVSYLQSSPGAPQEQK